MVERNNPHIGSTFEDFLRAEGSYETTTARAIKRVLARQIIQAMKDRGLSKAAMARSMDTSRAALDRLLDPDNESVTLNTLAKAAQVVGRQIRLELV
ncbi:MAG: Fis family transcriptional regulator [Alphaproteobacteria bacterium]|nr:Fis family transcriptional regulator [Alphaproteobacteria bacterium]